MCLLTFYNSADKSLHSIPTVTADALTSTSSLPTMSGVSQCVMSSKKNKSVGDKGRGRETQSDTRTPTSSSTSSSKCNKTSADGTKTSKHSSSSSNSSSTIGKPNKTTKSTPNSTGSKISANPKSAISSATKSKPSTSSSTAKPKVRPVAMSNFEDLLKTAKKNASGDKIATNDGKMFATNVTKSCGVGGRVLDGGRLKEPPRPRSSSPVGRSLLERNQTRLKNKRSHDAMMKGVNPRRSPDPTSQAPPPPSGRSGSRPGPMKSSDLVRRPLRSPVTNSPMKQNGLHRNGPQLGTDSSERQESKMALQYGSSSTNRGSTKGQVTSQLGGTSTSREGGLRGTKTPPRPPPSSLTPQQIQKLKAARAARAVAASGAPPAKKKALNPNSFYGSAAARILQRKGEPKLSGSGPLRYTSSYVDEMLDYFQAEGLGGVDDLYSDDEMDDFIASDDEFIDDSEDTGDYSSAIRKIFGYDRSR